jgi:hypothetical protein
MRLFVLAAHTVEVCNVSDISPVFLWFTVPRFGSMSWERVGCLIFALPTHFFARHGAWESFDLIFFLRYNSLSDTELFKLTDIILQFTTDSGVNFGTAFLGAFTNLRRTTISFIMSVRPSVRIEQLGSHWTDFHYILYWIIFRNSVRKIILFKTNSYIPF